jgi:hypothetical protein
MYYCFTFNSASIKLISGPPLSFTPPVIINHFYQACPAWLGPGLYISGRFFSFGFGFISFGFGFGHQPVWSEAGYSHAP